MRSASLVALCSSMTRAEVSRSRERFHPGDRARFRVGSSLAIDTQANGFPLSLFPFESALTSERERRRTTTPFGRPAVGQAGAG